MYILNLKTGIRQECHNLDVIKSCKKDVECYQVTETISNKMQTNDKIRETPFDLKGMKADDLKALAKEKGIDNAAFLTKEELLAVLKDVV